MNIGRKIQELRKVSGMTQEQLAEKLHISRQTVSKWEAGGTLPDLESTLKLCGIFHISLDDLLEEEKKLQNPGDRITIEEFGAHQSSQPKNHTAFYKRATLSHDRVYNYFYHFGGTKRGAKYTVSLISLHCSGRVCR